MIYNEKNVRRLIREVLLETVQKHRTATLLEQGEKEDQDFDPAELEGLNMPEYLKKMLDPNASKEVYAKMDQKVDDSGNPAHQAFAIAAFALSYGEMDAGAVQTILNRAKKVADKVLDIRAKSAEKNTGESETGETDQAAKE